MDNTTNEPSETTSNPWAYEMISALFESDTRRDELLPTRVVWTEVVRLAKRVEILEELLKQKA